VIENNDIKKLKSKIQIDRVFKDGKSIKSGDLIMHFIREKDEFKSIYIGVGVYKRFVQLAYRRNRIKRQIRAIVQQHKKEVLRSLPPGMYMILYKGKVYVASEMLEKDFEGMLKNFTVCG
tara:strand:+ start:3986 stop:4345 length:360 start_codon:yes stop_codon:yes gene_type:complete